MGLAAGRFLLKYRSVDASSGAFTKDLKNGCTMITLRCFRWKNEFCLRVPAVLTRISCGAYPRRI